MILRDPTKPSLVDQLFAERRAEDRTDKSYRRGQARLRARARARSGR